MVLVALTPNNMEAFAWLGSYFSSLLDALEEAGAPRPVLEEVADLQLTALRNHDTIALALGHPPSWGFWAYMKLSGFPILHLPILAGRG